MTCHLSDMATAQATSVRRSPPSGFTSRGPRLLPGVAP